MEDPVFRGPERTRGVVRVAAVQMTSTDDVGRNLSSVRQLVTDAAGRGASLVGLPENFAYLGSDRDHRLAIAEALPVAGADGSPERLAGPGPISGPRSGPILAAMQALARETHVHLLLGGFPEATPAGTHIRNTSVLLGPDGGILALYRKIHLFDVDLPGGATFRESDSVEPGDTAVVTDLGWGKLGLSVCYDLRFPELYRRLVGRGAEVLTVPSAFTAETGKDHWHVLLRARAIENLAFVVAPAQAGFHGGNRRSYGHALVVDPWGVVLAEQGEGTGVAVADLDLGYLAEVRRRVPCLDHRRL
jgi:predicted amidohydrolase